MKSALRVSDDLVLPLDAVTETFSVFGVRGRGKTNCAVVLAEELFAAGLPVVILDPIGVWWDLKWSADGKGPGLPIYIFGGSHGDLPLAPTAGALMADLEVEQRISMILDLKGFTGGERTKFVAAFAKRLLDRNAEPVHLIVEEADAFIPMRPYPGEQEMLGAMDRLVRWGRSSGIGATIVSQRPAKIHTDVRSQTGTLIAFGITGAHDRGAIDDWIRYHDGGAHRQEVLETLAGLPPGTAWVWSPLWLNILRQVRFRRRHTFDSAETPRVGAKRVVPKLASVDLDRLRAQMAETIEQAQANDPAVLRRRIDALQAELTARTKEWTDQVDRARAAEAELAQLRSHPPPAEPPTGLLESLDTWAAALERGARVLADSAAQARSTAAELRSSGAFRDQRNIRIGQKADGSRKAPQESASPPPDGPPAGRGLGRSQQRILDCLAWLESVGVAPVNRVQLAGFAGQSPRGGGFGNNLGALRSAGLLDYPASGMVALTDAGRAAALPPDVPPTSEALQEQVCAMVTASQAAILRALIARYPKPLGRQELAERVGQSATGGGFGNNLGRLRTLGWIDYPRQGLVVALPVLFLERAS